MKRKFNAITRLIAGYSRINTKKRILSGKLRTIWGTTPIITISLLPKCDKLLGFKSNSIVFITYYTSNVFDINLNKWDKIATRLTRYWPNSLNLFRSIIFLRILLSYDVFHLFYDKGILISPSRYGISPVELQLLKMSGKILFTYAYGGDVRSRAQTIALGTPNLCSECPDVGRFCVCDTEEHSSVLQRLDGIVTAKIAMGDMTAYIPNCRNIHYWPIDTDRIRPTPRRSLRKRSLKVAHAPNQAYFKGTQFLVHAIDRLQAEGHQIELIKIQGVSNDEVLKLFSESDLVADQFVAGFHGYTALEAMALGRPVLCFLRGPDMVIDPDSCPIINTHPDEIYSNLKKCLCGEIDLDTVGKQSRNYVEHYYSIEATAARLGQLYIESIDLSPEAKRNIADRIDELEACLPALAPGIPPVPWRNDVH
ncbi:MAG: hypothetical protein MPJ78_05490 [Hyphomicrobiaceae bacterium]|nr:hypothetical protein [Hyphomicrobiaceae bacterium]